MGWQGGLCNSFQPAAARLCPPFNFGQVGFVAAPLSLAVSLSKSTHPIHTAAAPREVGCGDGIQPSAALAAAAMLSAFGCVPKI